MTYDTYHLIFIISMIAAFVMFAVTAVLFFVLRIPSVIGDLSGRTARRAIEKIRNQNESTGEKVFKSSKVNRERGRVTDKITPSGNLQRRVQCETGAMSTERIAPFAAGAPSSVQAAGETVVLMEAEPSNSVAGETVVLGGKNESPYGESFAGQTTLLGEEITFAETAVGETTVLSAVPDLNSGAEEPPVFCVIYDKTLVSTDEIVC